VTGENGRSDPNKQQIPNTTTDAGIPAASDDHSLTVGADGPILLQDH
jgi:catalase